MKLKCALYGVKQTDRQRWALLWKTLVDKFVMDQCRADRCVFRKMEDKEGVLILVVHVDDLPVSGNETLCE